MEFWAFREPESDSIDGEIVEFSSEERCATVRVPENRRVAGRSGTLREPVPRILVVPASRVVPQRAGQASRPGVGASAH